MKLYLDEMISPAVAVALRERGHDVVSAIERDALGASDAHHLALAIRERRALVTYDVRDFSLLGKAAAASNRDHWGIVFVTARRFPPAAIGNLIDALDVLLADTSRAAGLESRTIFLEKPSGSR